MCGCLLLGFGLVWGIDWPWRFQVLPTVEDQLGAARALVVDAPRDPELLALGRLARLEVVELLDELGVVVRDLELVRVRVRLGVLEHCYARGPVSKATPIS